MGYNVRLALSIAAVILCAVACTYPPYWYRFMRHYNAVEAPPPKPMRSSPLTTSGTDSEARPKSKIDKPNRAPPPVPTRNQDTTYQDIKNSGASLPGNQNDTQPGPTKIPKYNALRDGSKREHVSENDTSEPSKDVSVELTNIVIHTEALTERSAVPLILTSDSASTQPRTISKCLFGARLKDSMQQYKTYVILDVELLIAELNQNDTESYFCLSSSRCEFVKGSQSIDVECGDSGTLTVAYGVGSMDRKASLLVPELSEDGSYDSGVRMFYPNGDIWGVHFELPQRRILVKREEATELMENMKQYKIQLNVGAQIEWKTTGGIAANIQSIAGLSHEYVTEALPSFKSIVDLIAKK